jgi:hypothetical protein
MRQFAHMCSCSRFRLLQSKIFILAALVASASAFAPAVVVNKSTQLFNQKKPTAEEAAEMGYSMGGEDYTRAVTPQVNDDPRKTIPQGESFEEYMKNRK